MQGVNLAGQREGRGRGRGEREGGVPCRQEGDTITCRGGRGNGR